MGNKKIIGIFLIVVFCFCGCDNNKGTTQVGNPNIGSTVKAITIGKIENESSLLIFPLSVFGPNESALNGASIDIFVGGESLANLRYANLKPTTYYDKKSKSVRFVMHYVHDNDLILFVIHLSNNTIVQYSGHASDSQNTQALPLAENPAVQLVEALCKKVVQCDASVTATVCQSDLKASDMFYGVKFVDQKYAGVIPGGEETLGDVIDGFQQGIYLVENNDLNSCLNHISALSCPTSAWYDPDNPDHFSRLENVIEPPCEGMVLIDDVGFSD